MIIRELGMTVFGLLCGSILFGRALPKWIKGIDVTEVSNDHNPGTANAMKYAGVPVGILCLLGDLLKGALPVYVAVGMGLVTDSWFPLIMAAPVLGHAYSLFYHGNGGKAIAVSFGVLIGLAPVQPELLLFYKSPSDSCEQYGYFRKTSDLQITTIARNPRFDNNPLLYQWQNKSPELSHFYPLDDGLQPHTGAYEFSVSLEEV